MVEGNLAIELQAQAIDDALRRGVIRRRQIEDVAVATAGALRTALETRGKRRGERVVAERIHEHVRIEREFHACRFSNTSSIPPAPRTEAIPRTSSRRNAMRSSATST